MNTTINCAQLLGSDGPFAETIPDFNVREEQQTMASLVQGTIEKHQKIVIEAPSGLGKTWAYLVPVISQTKKTIISTAGHYLQKQLFERDIPQVQKSLGISRQIAILKGRHNYLCPYYLKQHIDGDANGSHLSKASKPTRSVLSHYLQHFRQTSNGDLTRLKPKKALLPYLSCSDEACLAKSCPDYAICPLVKARQRAQHADVVIVNHSLLLSSSYSGMNPLIHNAETIIIDEAHRLLEFNQTFTGKRISSRQLHWFFRELSSAVKQYAIEDASIKQFIKSTEHWLSQLNTQIPTLDVDSLPAHRALVTQCLQLFKQLESWFGVAAERAYSLKQLSIQSHQFLTTLTHILEDPGLCWLQGQGRSWLIQNSAIHRLDSLQPLLQTFNDKAWVFTSATLSTQYDMLANNDAEAADSDSPSSMGEGGERRNSLGVDKFLKRLGLSSESFYRLSSPFDSERQARLYKGNLKGLPSQADYYPSFSQLLMDFVKWCPGRVLVLFSSYRALNQTHELLLDASFETAEQTVLLAQQSKTQDVVDHFSLLESFRQNKQVVLLATGSFWEGVDLSGAKLSAVVIDKLPFSSPIDPFVKLRSQYLEQHGVDCFNEFMLPEAIIKLRQGCGRLLRRKDDKGVIMIADPRLSTKNYGDMFVRSLPALPVCETLNDVGDFFKEALPE